MSLNIKLNIPRDSFNLKLNCQIPLKGVTAIYGHSGAGKTTLLRALAGLEKHSSNTIIFKQSTWQDAGNFIPSHLRSIGYVFQDSRLLPHLNVEQNLLYAYKRRNQSSNYTHDFHTLCQQLNISHLLSQQPATLSGGQQQRVAIARALLQNPQLLLLDEPLSALDSQSREEILQLLEQLLADIKIPVLYISHNIEEVSRFADHLILLENGQLAAQGEIIELCHRLDLSLSHESNAAAIIEGTINSHDPEFHLSSLSLGENQQIFIHSRHKAGAKMRVRIPAKDVSITLQPHNDSSILNCLQCQIVEVEHSPNNSLTHALIKLQLADHQYLLARITKKSLSKLKLKEGQTVYAQVKTVALLSQASASAENNDHKG